MKIKSIRFQVTAFMAGVMLCLLISSAFFLYTSITKSSEDTISHSSMESCSRIASQIDADIYQKFLENPNESENYWIIRNQLNQYRETLGALYIYTVRLDESKNIRIMIDGQPQNSDLASPINEISSNYQYDTFTPVLQGKTVRTIIIHDNKYGDFLSVFTPIKDKNGKVVGILGIDTSTTLINSVQKQVVSAILPRITATGLILSIIILLITFFAVKRILNSLELLQLTILQIASAEGDLTVRLSTNNNHEINLLSQAVNSMIEHTQKLVAQIKSSVQEVTMASQQMDKVAKQTGLAATSIANNITDMAEGANKQASHVEITLQLVDATHKYIEDSDENVSKVVSSAYSSAKMAKSGQTTIAMVAEQFATVTEKVRVSSTSVQKLGKHSERIGSIITTITDISNQTNLLALNAAIEAARAGEHGRGFAVVAEEVRKLAEETKHSSEEVKQIIQDIQSETTTTVQNMETGLLVVERQVEIIENCSDILEDIVTSIDETASEVDHMKSFLMKINETSGKMFQEIESISTIIKNTTTTSCEVAAATQEQLAMIEEMSANSAELAHMAQQLSSEISRFRV